MMRRAHSTTFRKALAAAAAAGLAAAVLGLSGCSRRQMNYQIAEAIGTDGKYENNEPVETPKMKEQRAAQEQSESEEQNVSKILQTAADQAAGYNYEEAIATLNTLSGNLALDSRVAEARKQYEAGDAALTAWDGDIPHLCFPTLIEDPSRAFDGDSLSDTYKSTMVTTDEFKAMLQSLYENNYILVDIHSIAKLQSEGDMELQTLRLPSGKKPIVLSQDNVDYSSVKNGDGIATALTVEDGAVKAKYTDADGHDLSGDYDLIPILDSFVAEHPDFSFRGARGIVSVSGKNGVFGYQLPDTGSSGSSSESENGDQADSSSGSSAASYTDDQKVIAEIAKVLTDEGWSIASAGWSHSYMNDASMTTDQFRQEIDSWESKVAPLTGKADILFFPYGAEVSYPGDSLSYLLENGLVYLCGLWGDTDYKEIGDGYMRMTRRFVDGYSLKNAPDNFSSFFNVSDLIDKNR